MATRPKTTRIADDTTQAVPQTTSAGDAPADTYDAHERVSSAQTDKAAAAAAGHQVVNAVEPVGTAVFPSEATVTNVRTETYTQVKPDGTQVTVTHELETGETTVTTVP